MFFFTSRNDSIFSKHFKLYNKLAHHRTGRILALDLFSRPRTNIRAASSQMYVNPIQTLLSVIVVIN